MRLLTLDRKEEELDEEADGVAGERHKDEHPADVQLHGLWLREGRRVREVSMPSR